MWMTALTLLYASVVAFVGAFLFRAVDWLEPNRRLALVLKYAIIAVGAVAIANQLLPDGLLAARGRARKSAWLNADRFRT